MRFAEALEGGKTQFGVPENIITTLVSKIFIFENTVLKVYKHETFFFADLHSYESRKIFYGEDFFYNNTAAPEIYTHLWGVQERDGVFSFVPFSAGEDFVIEMSRIDDSKTFTKLLINNQLTKSDIEGFVEALVATVRTLTRERRDQLDFLFHKGLLEIMRENTKSLHDWMLSQAPRVPKDDCDTVYELLTRVLESEVYFKDIQPTELSCAIDNNCDNLILLNGKPSFIDIMPPMVVWRVVDEYATVSRLIVDVEALAGPELGEVARATYARYGDVLPPAVRLMHEIRAAGIQWPYRYMLGQDAVAERFGVYTKKKIEELRGLLQ